MLDSLILKLETEILPVSINDLRDRYFDNLPLTQEEELALSNFDQYRIQQLNQATSDEDFKTTYLKIQAMANLSSYRDFLNLDLLGATIPV